jgi:hypothetical protein
MSGHGDSWACPNDPPCPHGSVVHDIYDYDDPLPTCCFCDCGHDPALRERLRREQEAEALRREQEWP